MNKQINHVSFNFEKECKMLVNATVPYALMASTETTYVLHPMAPVYLH